jgi:hypothetical protein
MRALLERQVLQYQLSGSETLGRGPLVLLLDKSSSMEGSKDTWATALALALLEHAHAERRPFALIDFNASVSYETTVHPAGQLPHEALFVSCGGGTSIATAFERGLEIIGTRALRKGSRPSGSRGRWFREEHSAISWLPWSTGRSLLSRRLCACHRLSHCTLGNTGRSRQTEWY